MSLKAMKDQMKKSNKKKMQDEGKSTSSKDPRFYVPSVDENNKINVKVRLLPSGVYEDGELVGLDTYKKVQFHNISHCGKEKRWMPKTLCRKSINKDCPICDHGWEVYNEIKDGNDANKKKAMDKARKWLPDEKYITNILVLEDKQKPENEGKVFLYEMGVQVFNNIKAQMSATENKAISERDLLEDEDGDLLTFDAWDLDDSFIMLLSRTAGVKDSSGNGYKEFPVWSKSRLMLEKGSEEIDEDEQERLLEASISLDEFKNEDSYMTVEQVEEKLDFLTYQTDGKSEKESSKETKAKEKSIAEEVDEDDEDEVEVEAPVKKKRVTKSKKKVEPEPEPEESVEDDELDIDVDSIIDEIDDI